MPLAPSPADAPYLSRALRVVVVPSVEATDVRAVLLYGGVPMLPAEPDLSNTHVIALAADADLDTVAALLRDYSGWPH